MRLTRRASLSRIIHPNDFEKITDILDVWFDSGSTHAFVLEDRDDLSSPADLYLEGSTSIAGGSIRHCCNLAQPVTAPPTRRF